jgi:hypothetical protein
MHRERESLDRSESGSLVDNEGEPVDKCCKAAGLGVGEGSACSEQGFNRDLGLVSVWSLYMSIKISRRDYEKLTSSPCRIALFAFISQAMAPPRRVLYKKAWSMAAVNKSVTKSRTRALVVSLERLL